MLKRSQHAADAGTHLAGGRVGERDGDELAQAGRPSVVGVRAVEMRKEPLGEDERLAATRRGRESDRHIACFDGGALFGGEGGGHTKSGLDRWICDRYQGTLIPALF